MSMDGSEVCTNVTIIDDKSFEKVEYFTVLVSSEPNVMVRNNLTVRISDDDGIYLCFVYSMLH